MTYNKIFILVSLNLTKEFYKSLSDLPYVRNLEIYEFEDLNLNSLQRLVKLFKSDIKSYKINSSKIKLLSLEILGHSQKVFVNRNRKVFIFGNADYQSVANKITFGGNLSHA